jgi:hypothetical protein
MKTFISTLTLFLSAFSLSAQEGYIKFNKNSMVKGFIKVHTAHQSGEHQIEYHETKEDPQPKRYHKKDIMEYAIKHDTFRILKNFYPFDIEDFYFEVVDAKVLRSGKVNLLGVDSRHHTISNYSGGGLLSALLDESLAHLPYVYVLHDSENDYARGIPSKKDKFREYMIDFFSEEIIAGYEKEKGTLHFRDLEKFVVYYNSNY